MNEFNSQVCTSVEQSKRLLAMGLKPETADMYMTNMSIKGFQYTDPWQIGSKPYKDVMSFWAEKGIKLENENWEIIPAWSLHRLLCLLYPREDVYLIMPSTAYKDIIDDIENEIKCGGFNKEYLKQIPSV